jgi:hypothetical protein
MAIPNDKRPDNVEISNSQFIIDAPVVPACFLLVHSKIKIYKMIDKQVQNRVRPVRQVQIVNQSSNYTFFE